MTKEDQTELRRELLALDQLLTKLVPEDDLSRLAMDAKRQSAAAQMVGTITLARELLGKSMNRVMGAQNGNLKESRAPNAYGAKRNWIRAHMPSDWTPKNEFAARCRASGVGYSAIDSTIRYMVAKGEAKARGPKGNREIMKI